MSLSQARIGEWLNPDHEMPHAPAQMPMWVENYLTYVYSPATSVGVYLHYRHVPGSAGGPDLWDELVQIVLPGDRYLTSRAFGQGHITRGDAPGLGRINVSGLTYTCEKPFERWTKEFIGGARLVSGADLRRGPVEDGPHVPVHLHLNIRGLGAPFDYGTAELDQAWGKAHYEQHHEADGFLLVDGERFDIAGTGLRDHSWGPREFSKMGRTTWIHASFPESQRAFAMCYVAASPPHVPDSLLWTVVHENGEVYAVESFDVPEAMKLTQVYDDAEFTMLMPDGRKSTVRTTLLQPLRMYLMRGSEIGHGSPHPAGPHPHATHHYCPTFVKVEWDGETGFGYNERSVELL